MLYTASFYTPEDWVDRLYRVSRGHPRGRRPQWETLPFLYPQRELLQAYRSGQMDFAAFEIEYRRGLDQVYEGLAEFREWLGAVPLLGNFTLLCFERASQPCHRRTLAQWLLEHPDLSGSLSLGLLR